MIPPHPHDIANLFPHEKRNLTAILALHLVHRRIEISQGYLLGNFGLIMDNDDCCGQVEKRDSRDTRPTLIRPRLLDEIHYSNIKRAKKRKRRNRLIDAISA